MSTTELRTSINAELDYFSDQLLADVEAYVKSISPRRKKRPVKPLFDKPTKLEIDEETKSIMGRFPVPDDFNEKEFIAEHRLKDYLSL
ncbi:MAG: hypothetical protein J6Z14_10560 [Prevotella sp.]|nr:hypothetical protein [Prevotella sp.]